MFGESFMNTTWKSVLRALVVCGVMVFLNPAMGQQKTIDVIMKSISVEIDEGKYSEATRVIRAVDLHEIEMPKNKNRGEFKYLAVRGFGASVPGLPKWRARSALTESSVIFIAGTSDYSKNADEEEFQNVAVAFAAKYNMLARYYGTTEVHKEGEVELSTVCQELSLTKEKWEHIPLHARLKIRNLVEAVIEKESDKRGK